MSVVPDTQKASVSKLVKEEQQHQRQAKMKDLPNKGF